ncbi:MAG TPA: FAD-binding oxidoreductase [Bryobacteraceae bacterium]|nr:FAD-binding oxidoreductase [Bryobacteraceae bacterium]
MPAPQTPCELADSIRAASSHGRTIALGGNGSKRRMAGPVFPADEVVSTAGLRRVLQYEPHDLTISVEAGLPWRELTRVLAAKRQMVPLDPPFALAATVGGVIASNSSGPRRRLYGSARDLVIGMQFATLEGKLVSAGGMVVKNVAGLDLSKLMIGSFGTLAAIAVINFKLLPMPELERSFLLPFESLSKALAARDTIIGSVLQPSALDLLNPAAGATLGNRSWMLAVRGGGNEAVIVRYERDLAKFSGSAVFDGPQQDALWHHVQEFTPRFLESRPDGAVVRASCTLKGLESVMESFPGPAVARAGSGVCYGYFEGSRAAGSWLADASHRGRKAVMEYSPEDRKGFALWPSPGGDFAIMQRVKNLFDPGNLLNRGRLYGRI